LNLLERATTIGVQGFLHSSELEQLCDLACGKDVLEVGSFMGLSAWGMAITAHSLWCVDPFDSATDGQRRTGQVTTLEAFKHAVSRYSHVKYFVGTSEEAAKQTSMMEPFDMIFIDANHTYEDCLADIQRWWPLVKKGGVLAGHDYLHAAFPGVAKAFDEVFGPADAADVTVTLRVVRKP